MQCFLLKTTFVYIIIMIKLNQRGLKAYGFSPLKNIETEEVLWQKNLYLLLLYYL